MFTVKYSPKSLKDVLDHESVKKRLREWIEGWFRGKTGKPLLLYGPPGVGKTSIVYALARDYNLEVVELSSSHYRDWRRLSSLTKISFYSSLFGKRKVVLIDDLDGLTRDDRGAISYLNSIIPKLKVPVLMTANDPWDKKLLPLRQMVELLEMKRLPYRLIYSYLLKIADKEGIDDKDLVKKIALYSQGDLRSALNDLYIKTYSYRQRKEDIFRVLLLIFKGSSLKSSLASLAVSDVDVETLMLWLAENIAREYENKDEVAKAFNFLSRADVFNGRIIRRQYWGFLRYVSLLSTAGVALSKEKVYRKFTSYRYPRWLRLLSTYQEKRTLKKSLSKKISKKFHLPLSFVIANFDFYSKLILRDLDRAKHYFSLTDEEEAFLREMSKEKLKGKK